MKHYIAILLLFVLSWAGSARLSCTYANEAIRFSHISIDEGLSQSYSLRLLLRSTHL